MEHNNPSLDTYEADFRMDRVTSGGHVNQDACEISGGRLVMVSGHIAQYVPFANAGPRQLRAGVEAEYAKATWHIAIDADEDIVIDTIFNKYDVDHDKIKTNEFNTTYVISHGLKSGRVYCTEVPYYMSHHTLWGFKLVHTPLMESLQPGLYIEADHDKILAHGPSRLRNGDWAFGAECNCSYLGTFNTNEDGCGASLEAKEVFKTEMYTVTEFFVESNQVLINKYGEDNGYYKPIPSVGDVLGSQGLIAVKRDMRKAYSLCNMTNRALTKTIRPFDQEIHALPNSTVIEVEVIKGPRSNTDDMPYEMVRYLDSLSANRRKHLQTFQDIDRRYLMRARDNHKEDYLRHPSSHVKFVDAENEIGQTPKNKTRPSVILNEAVCSGYFVRIVTRKINKPQLGHKFTGLSGEKFVICDFKKPEDMPTDKWGRHSMFNANPVGVVNRNNPSQLFQQYTSDACFHTRLKMLAMRDAGESIEAIWDYLLGFYLLASPNSYRMATTLLDKSEIPAYIDTIMDYRIDLEDEVGDLHLGVNIVSRLNGTVYQPPRDVVTFRDSCGNLRTSKYPCRVSNKYLIVMEKIGKHASASSIPLRQNCGFAAKQSSQQKRITQLSSKPSRVFGEAEFRAIVANAGPELAKRLITILSNPRASKLMADEALSHLGFMDIEDIEYRSLGMNLLRHLLQCYGTGIEYMESDAGEVVRVLTAEELGEEL